jgi:sec-independent protein translocase protein TatC
MGDALCMGTPDFQLINTTLSGQFTMHIWVSLVAGFVVAFPYVVFELWRFIRPALRQTELRFSKSIIFFVSLLFCVGILFGYYVITPLSVNFLSGYQVSEAVKNMIEVESFISTVTTITFASGLVFQLPVLIYFLSLLGLVTPAFLRKYRKHSIVVILIVAAVITPSPDITSQLLVATPLYLLYEISIFVSAYVHNKNS